MSNLNIEIYSTTYCPYCDRAKELFDRKGVSYTSINIEEDIALRNTMMERSKRRTVPQIFINDQHIGGCDDLYDLDAAGKLDDILKL